MQIFFLLDSLGRINNTIKLQKVTVHLFVAQWFLTLSSRDRSKNITEVESKDTQVSLGRPDTGAKDPADNSLDKNRLKAPQGLLEIREPTETHGQGRTENLPARKEGVPDARYGNAHSGLLPNGSNR
jgi:hypothetical protein